MPYDPSLQIQAHHRRQMHQRMSDQHAASMRYRRRRGRSGGGFSTLLLLVLVAAGAYVYVAHPGTWHSLVAQAEALIRHIQQSGRN